MNQKNQDTNNNRLSDGSSITSESIASESIASESLASESVRSESIASESVALESLASDSTSIESTLSNIEEQRLRDAIARLDVGVIKEIVAGGLQLDGVWMNRKKRKNVLHELVTVYTGRDTTWEVSY